MVFFFLESFLRIHYFWKYLFFNHRVRLIILKDAEVFKMGFWATKGGRGGVGIWQFFEFLIISNSQRNYCLILQGKSICTDDALHFFPGNFISVIDGYFFLKPHLTKQLGPSFKEEEIAVENVSVIHVNCSLLGVKALYTCKWSVKQL